MLVSLTTQHRRKNMDNSIDYVTFMKVINIMIKEGNIEKGMLNVGFDTSSGRVKMTSLRDSFTNKEQKKLVSLGFEKISDNEFSSDSYTLTTKLVRSEVGRSGEWE